MYWFVWIMAMIARWRSMLYTAALKSFSENASDCIAALCPSWASFVYGTLPVLDMRGNLSTETGCFYIIKGDSRWYLNLSGLFCACKADKWLLITKPVWNGTCCLWSLLIYARYKGLLIADNQTLEFDFLTWLPLSQWTGNVLLPANRTPLPFPDTILVNSEALWDTLMRL